MGSLQPFSLCLRPPLCCLLPLSALIPLALSGTPSTAGTAQASFVGQVWTPAQYVGISMELCA